jgi:TRAP-type C4-dicarboxylate transport system permease small subunit
MRKVFNYSLSWSEELSRYLFIWQCWVGISLAERFGKHIRITMLSDKLRGRWKVGLEIFVTVVLLCTAIFLAKSGFEMSGNLFAAGSSSPALKIPLYLIYISLPVGCMLYCVKMMSQFVNLIRRKDVG